MDALVQHLEGLDIPVSPALREQLRAFRRRSLPGGTYYVQSGKTAPQLAFLLSGQIQHYYNIDGKIYTRWVALSGCFTTAFKSFVFDQPSAANLVCLGAVELLEIDRTTFRALCEEHPALQQLWQRSLENEMAKYEDWVTQLITADSTARYLNFMANHPRHAREVPLKYIASMLGIEPRHLSRIRKKLADG